MTDLTPERRDKMRRAVAECSIPMGSTMWPVGGPTFLALLDAADERDLLAAAVERAQVLHVPDGEGFCVACDYMTPHPCPTRRALL